MARVENSKEAQKVLKRRDRAKEKQRRQDLRYIMGDRRGRRFVYAETFVNGNLLDVYLSSDSGIYRHEGKRERAVKLVAEIQEVCPEEYLLMINERLQDQREDKMAAAEAETIAAEDGDEP